MSTTSWLLALLLGLMVWAVPATAQSPSSGRPTIRADKSEIMVGEEASIEWSTSERVAGVYITGLGLVPPMGRERVRPLHTTTYILVTNEAHEAARPAVTIAVSGLRGADEFPRDDDQQFSYPLRVTSPAVGLTDLVARVEAVLQNDFGFSVRALTLRNEMRFVTTRGIRPDLLKGASGRPMVQRLAYRVDIEPPRNDDPIVLTITTLIEFRRRAELTWYPDPDERLHRQASDALRAKLVMQSGAAR